MNDYREADATVWDHDQSDDDCGADCDDGPSLEELHGIATVMQGRLDEDVGTLLDELGVARDPNSTTEETLVDALLLASATQVTLDDADGDDGHLSNMISHAVAIVHDMNFDLQGAFSVWSESASNFVSAVRYVNELPREATAEAISLVECIDAHGSKSIRWVHWDTCSSFSMTGRFVKIDIGDGPHHGAVHYTHPGPGRRNVVKFNGFDGVEMRLLVPNTGVKIVRARGGDRNNMPKQMIRIAMFFMDMARHSDEAAGLYGAVDSCYCGSKDMDVESKCIMCSQFYHPWCTEELLDKLRSEGAGNVLQLPSGFVAAEAAPMVKQYIDEWRSESIHMFALCAFFLVGFDGMQL